MAFPNERTARVAGEIVAVHRTILAAYYEIVRLENRLRETELATELSAVDYASTPGYEHTSTDEINAANAVALAIKTSLEADNYADLIALQATQG